MSLLSSNPRPDSAAKTTMTMTQNVNLFFDYLNGNGMGRFMDCLCVRSRLGKSLEDLQIGMSLEED